RTLHRVQDSTVAEVTSPAAEKGARAFAKQPQAEAVVRGVLGKAYANVARYPDAKRELQRAWELRHSLGQIDDPEALTLQYDLALALLQAGEVDRSREILKPVLEKRLAQLGPDRPQTLSA